MKSCIWIIFMLFLLSCGRTASTGADDSFINQDTASAMEQDHTSVSSLGQEAEMKEYEGRINNSISVLQQEIDSLKKDAKQHRAEIQEKENMKAELKETQNRIKKESGDSWKATKERLDTLMGKLDRKRRLRS